MAHIKKAKVHISAFMPIFLHYGLDFFFKLRNVNYFKIWNNLDLKEN